MVLSTDVWLIIGTVCGIITGGIGAVYCVLSYRMKKVSLAEEKRLVVENTDLKDRISHNAGLIVENTRLKVERETSQAVVANLSVRLQKSQSDNCSLRVFEKRVRIYEARCRKITKTQGQLWYRKVRSADAIAPVHLPGKVVISVVNLKGGVGKTHVSQCLAMTGISCGIETLLIDCDLQGSLSESLVGFESVTKLSRDKKLIQHFLSRRFGKSSKASLRPYCHEIMNGLKLVGATDSLAYRENVFLLHWMMNATKDPRFLLRKGMQGLFTTEGYTPDLTIIDCPPVLNLSCINALCASDLVIIPVNPSNAGIRRVPQLIHHIKLIQTHLNPNLDLFGVIMNRTYGDNKLTGRELSYVEELQKLCGKLPGRSAWQREIPLMQTSIRNSLTLKTDFESPDWCQSPSNELLAVAKSLAQELSNKLMTTTKTYTDSSKFQEENHESQRLTRTS